MSNNPAPMPRRDALRRLLLLVTCALILLPGGCDKRGPDSGDDSLRIVSLSPAITQVLIELDLGHAVVAVGEGDDVAPADTPSLGRYVDLDLERLTTLRPTHVLAMTGKAGLPPRVTELAGQGGFALSDLAYPDDVDAAVRLVADVGRAVGRPERGRLLAETVRRQLDDIAALTAQRDRPRVLVVFQTDPVTASGPGTVNDALLHIAGGLNAAADATVSAPIYDREALLALAPELVIVMQPGKPPLTGMDDPRLGTLRGLGIPAVEHGRVALLNDPAVLLPGPSMATTAASLAVALHPDDAALAAALAEVMRDGP